MSIKVLSEQLASQIAAGEVVERPASVVKELVENAIDAEASTINVEVRGGGQKLIQVADDGDGIPADDIETAFMRHATSKLQSAADLEAIRTLGFRGEALAAIAAVSQVTAVSRTEEMDAGVRLTLEAGRKTSREHVGAPRGTVIAVSNLFYNVPARLKFLKSTTTEKKQIDEFISRYAMAYPNIRFRLSHDNRITFQSSGSRKLLDVLTTIYGPDTAGQLLEIARDGEDDRPGEQGRSNTGDSAIEVAGYVAPPNLNWSNRNQITLFVNGRWIKDHRLSYAVIQAYHTLLPTGRYPLAVIFLTMPAEALDVNVHPTKVEVRFRSSNSVFGALQRAVRKTLISDSPIPHTGHFGSFQHTDWASADRQPAFARHDRPEFQGQLELGRSRSTSIEPPSSGVPDRTDLGGDRLPVMRVIGQVGTAYIITEGPEGIYLIDQHAAHERILYEQFMAAWIDGEDGAIAAQGLVAGSVVHLSPAQATLLSDQLELLDRIGFQVEPFGPNAFMVRTVPALLAKLDPSRALQDVVEDLEQGQEPLEKAIESRIILRVCKSAAVKAGQTLTRQEMEAMVQQLEACQNPRTCPHGRPTLIHLSVAQLAREFGRT